MNMNDTVIVSVSRTRIIAEHRLFGLDLRRLPSRHHGCTMVFRNAD